MKKFVRFLSGVISVFMSAIVATPTTEAMWPAVPQETQETQENFNRALALGEAAATYCFFRPQDEFAEAGHYAYDEGLTMSMQAPPIGTPLKDIPVAVYLANAQAKEVFKHYFQWVKGTNEFIRKCFRPANLPKSNPHLFRGVDSKDLAKGIHPDENVFVMSLEDLRIMAYPYSTPGSAPRLVLWKLSKPKQALKEIIRKSDLHLEVNALEWEDLSYSNSDWLLCVRVMMDKLKTLDGERLLDMGDIARAYYGDSENEENLKYVRTWYYSV